MIESILRYFGYRLVPIPEGESRKKPKFIKATKRIRVMTFHYEGGGTKEYEGYSTVWHELPFMTRCSTPMEAKLCDIQAYIEKWGNPYPTAHTLKQNQDK